GRRRRRFRSPQPARASAPARSSLLHVLVLLELGGAVAAADRREVAEGRAGVVVAQATARAGVAADVAGAHAGDDLTGAPARVRQQLLQVRGVDQVAAVEAVV